MFAAAAVAAFAFASTAQAADVMESVAGQDLVNIMQEVGYTATLGTDNQGDPMVQGTIQNVGYTLYFYRCDQSSPKKCLDLQFHAEFSFGQPATLDQVNAYNTNNRFGQAFIDAAGNVGLDMSSTVQGGVTRQNIKEVIDWWKTALTSFEQKLLHPEAQ